MLYKFNNFQIKTEKKTELLKEKIAAAQTIENDKPKNFEWEHKTREFTAFKSLAFLETDREKYYDVINDIFVFIDLVEILKAFSSNKLNTNKTYKIANSFTAKTAQKNGDFYLKIHFTHYSNSLYLDKFECNSLAAKFSKILQRCEPWQELDQ